MKDVKVSLYLGGLEESLSKKGLHIPKLVTVHSLIAKNATVCPFPR